MSEWKPIETPTPRLIERYCGGWLAVSPFGFHLKFGVASDSKRSAVEKWRKSLAEWRASLAQANPLDAPTPTTCERRMTMAESGRPGGPPINRACSPGHSVGVPDAMTDPMERMIAEALSDAGYPFVADCQGNASGLDFSLPGYGVEIEVKQFHSDRIGEQMKRADNVIVAQGREAVEFLAMLIRGA